MMKLRNLMQVACMATAALTAFSCSQEEFENSGRKGNITVNATFEGAGRHFFSHTDARQPPPSDTF